jgi:calcineurin-like phosphoesterase
MAAPEKVFVALPAEAKSGRSTLSWALGHFRATAIVVTHVHVPPQMIPVST